MTLHKCTSASCTKPTQDEHYDQQLTHLAHRLGQSMTRSKNGIKGILRRATARQACPTKGVFTQADLEWLKSVE